MFLASADSFFLRPLPRTKALAPDLSSSNISWRCCANSMAAQSVSAGTASPWQVFDCWLRDKIFRFIACIWVSQKSLVLHKRCLANVAFELRITFFQLMCMIGKLSASETCCHGSSKRNICIVAWGGFGKIKSSYTGLLGASNGQFSGEATSHQTSPLRLWASTIQPRRWALQA